MALDFYDLDDIHLKNKLFQLDHKEFDRLNSVWLELKKVSGIYVDAYGVTRLHHNHVVLITSLIKTILDTSSHDKSVSKAYLNFSKAQGGLLMIGD